MQKFLIFCCLIFFSLFQSTAQEYKTILKGQLNLVSNDVKEPQVGVLIYWKNHEERTATDEDGRFEIKLHAQDSLIAESSIYGRHTEFITAADSFIEIKIQENNELKEFTVVALKKSFAIQFRSIEFKQSIGEETFQRAACCDLSEAFQNVPSVDASFTDAITGIRQIKLLGLDGKYSPILFDNMPGLRGMSLNSGLSLVPAAWIKEIYLSKGTGSVMNGFESTTGQINLCLKEQNPEEGEDYFLADAFANMNRYEIDFSAATPVTDKIHTRISAHYGTSPNQIEPDRNNDGFLDMPNFNFLAFDNRWKVILKQGWRTQFGLNYALKSSQGGQFGSSDTLFQSQLRNELTEAWLKLGKVFPKKKHRSFGSQFKISRNVSDNVFGQKNLNLYRGFDAQQDYFYGNLIYETILFSTFFKIKTGLSFVYDDYKIQGKSGYTLLKDDQLSRKEATGGGFFEGNLRISEKSKLMLGIRADNSNLFGLFFTPRLHFMHEFKKPRHQLRVNIGKGYRTINILPENLRMFASGREIDNLVAEWQQERAWNSGISYIYPFRLGLRNATLTADYYYTIFENKLIADYDLDSRLVSLYTLDDINEKWGSQANSFQLTFDYEPFKRSGIKIAARYFDVQDERINDKKLNPILLPKFRSFVNFFYKTRNLIEVSTTLNFIGEQRLPSVADKINSQSFNEMSPSYFLWNMNISKQWGFWNVYLGTENILNYRQEIAIVNPNEPFSRNFDATLVYAPIFGTNIYAGFRYRLKKQKN